MSAPTAVKNTWQPPLSGRLLVVDDHATARMSMGETLRAAGPHVVESGSALEALERIKSDSFDVILTDLRMPGMTGLEFIRDLERRDARVQIVMVTAYASVATAV
jgi:CheY-like chemotaxis protein